MSTTGSGTAEGRALYESFGDRWTGWHEIDLGMLLYGMGG